MTGITRAPLNESGEWRKALRRVVGWRNEIKRRSTLRVWVGERRRVKGRGEEETHRVSEGDKEIKASFLTAMLNLWRDTLCSPSCMFFLFFLLALQLGV